jgi:exopolysaccharide production protein ExoZ
MKEDKPRSQQTILSIQYLRFAAALLVVCYHSWALVKQAGRGDLGNSFELGTAGVDIFFAISGFIMTVITSRGPQSPAQFMINRVLRIGPTYWLMTVVIAVLLLAMPSAFIMSRWSLGSLIASLAFIPYPHATLSGVEPLLTVGWTLNYEMFFYCIIALSIFVSYRFRMEISCAILLALVITGWALQTDDIYGKFYTSPLLLEFVFGVIVGKLYLRDLILAPRVAAVMLALAIPCCLAPAFFPSWHPGSYRVFELGLPSVGLLYLVVSADKVLPESRILHMLGDASYSIYLTHPFVLTAVRLGYQKLKLSTWASDALLIGSAVLFSVAVGVAFYWMIEKPLMHWVSTVRKNWRSRRVVLGTHSDLIGQQAWIPNAARSVPE